MKTRRSPILQSDDALRQLVDRTAIIGTIVGIANAIDRKDWGKLRSLLADELDTDYSQFRGEPAGRVVADAYVASRKEGLEGVRTLHISTNHEVAVRGDEADCYSAYQIFRVAEGRGERLDTAGTYEHRLVRAGDGWLVRGIKQTVVVLSGDRSVHGALRRGAGVSEDAT